MIQGMRKTLVTSALVAISVALAACANAPAHPSNARDDPAAVLLAASAKTQAAGSAHMAFLFSIQTGGKTQSFTGDADIDFGGGDPTKAEAHMTFAFPKTSGFDMGSMEMTLDAGPVIYIRSKLFTGFLGSPTPWIKIDPSTVPGLSSQLGSLTGGQADPTGSLGMLYGLVDVKDLGADTIEGEPATHYRATFDLSKALREIPAARRAALQQAIDGLEKQTGGTLPQMPFDVWIDAKGYLKKFGYQLDVPAGTGQTSGSFAMTITLSDVGAPVDIQPPPADQVTDIADLMPATSTSSP
jgi:hypothetical protein